MRYETLECLTVAQEHGGIFSVQSTPLHNDSCLQLRNPRELIQQKLLL